MQCRLAALPLAKKLCCFVGVLGLRGRCWGSIDAIATKEKSFVDALIRNGVL